MPISGLSPWESQMKGPLLGRKGTDVTVPIPEMRKVPSHAHALPPDCTYCLTQARVHFPGGSSQPPGRLITSHPLLQTLTSSPTAPSQACHSPSHPQARLYPPHTSLSSGFLPIHAFPAALPMFIFLCSHGSNINTPTCALSLSHTRAYLCTPGLWPPQMTCTLAHLS